MKHNHLRKMLDGHVEIDHGWSVPAASLGKERKQRLPPDIWAQVGQTYVGGRIAGNLDALAHTMALFLRAAVEVGKHLEYAWLSLNWLRRTIL